MKKQHISLIVSVIFGLILGLVITVLAFILLSPDSTQSEAEAESQTETQVEYQSEAAEASSTELTDAEYVKAMSERDQAHLIAIVCLATEQGHSPSEVAESIAENFDAISEDYAQRFVSASLLTVCNQASE